MKLLNRLRQALGGVSIEPAGQSVWSFEGKLDMVQLDDEPPTIAPELMQDDMETLRQGGRRHIPDIHEDIPPSGLRALDDDAGFDPV